MEYLVGLPKNVPLNALAASLLEQAEQAFAQDQQKQRVFGWIDCAAGSWDRERRIVVKAEHGELGGNPRYLVTSLEGDAQHLYDKVYCLRGEIENLIKEQQLGLFADRTSCYAWWANQFRVLLSAAAYVLMETIRRLAPPGPELPREQVGTIRLKLLKIGGVILRNTRRIRVFFSSAYPYQELFTSACAALGRT